ncbi:MAG: hypothetical protein IK133_10200 [Clostridia bacterium]|nr:hypothetical protein [Clostridia bacterium]
MLLKNAYLRIEIADNSGAVLRLTNRQNGKEYISARPETALRITQKKYGRPMPLEAASFSCRRADEEHADLVWRLSDGSTFRAEIALDGTQAAFTSSLVSAKESEIILAEYPVIGGMGRWDPQMEMVHSFATGLLVRDPLSAFSEGEGIRYAPYPESFSGASMQFFAYYGKESGGLLFAARDPDAHMKWLNLYRNQDAMEATLMYANEDIGKGKGFAAPWSFTVSLLPEGNWFAAAKAYKEWAVRQPWCAMGTLDQRRHCGWLMKDIGWTTFGIDAAYDRSEYIRLYHKDIGVPGFHILGPDWTQQDFMGHVPANLHDWTQLRFDRQNLRAIKEVGDRFAPFEFDFLVHPQDEETKKNCGEARQIFPPRGHTYSCDAYDFNMLCPCEKYTRDLHVKRDVIVTDDSGADAMYYDISANNLLHFCLAEGHTHPKGGGYRITEGYKSLYEETKKACAKKRGEDYFPVGTEMINEVFLPELDFYQSRAGARPSSALELWPYKKQIDLGQVELVPLFAAVYHEYGAVRMDGWGKLVEETGDLFYDIVAKIYQWGGLYEINHEYSPMEAIDGKETLMKEHYWPFAQYGYEYSHGRARYLRQFAALRTGIGNPYLAYGKMEEPPETGCKQEDKYYWHYNHGHGNDEKFAGTITLPAVRADAWCSGLADHPGYAVFLTNTSLKAQRVSLRLDPDVCGSGTVRKYTGFDPEHAPECEILAEINNRELVLDLELPSRKPVMIEIT